MWAGPACVQPSPYSSKHLDSKHLASFLPPGGQFPWGPHCSSSCVGGSFPKPRGSSRSEPREPLIGSHPDLSKPSCQNTSHTAPERTHRNGEDCSVTPTINWPFLSPLPPTCGGSPVMSTVLLPLIQSNSMILQTAHAQSGKVTCPGPHSQE